MYHTIVFYSLLLDSTVFAMCGICGMLIKEGLSPEQIDDLKFEFYKSSCKIKHRGPDRSTSTSFEHPINAVIDFKRLAIMDTSTRGDQPFKYEYVKPPELNGNSPVVKPNGNIIVNAFTSEMMNSFHKDSQENRTVYVTCNGEIYKYKDIVQQCYFKLDSGSDCEVIMHLYKKYGIDKMDTICNMLNSEHAFSIFDVNTKTGDYILILSSDRYGIRPLFTKVDSKGFYYSSELQGLPNIHDSSGIVNRFPPAHYGIIEKKEGKLGEIKYHRYYSVSPGITKNCNDLAVAQKGIRDIFTDAVICRLDANRPVGALLSGGLDSSLVCAIAANHLKQFGCKLRTFSIGIAGTESIDKPYAEQVAKFIHSDHTYIEFTEQEFLDAIPDVIKAIGSYDITTVRASTGQYLISKWISQNTNIKVLLCGDGSDEVMQGYLYSFNGPSAEELHLDSIRLIENIHFFDGLRADRCVSHWGMELRIPYLDHRFVDWIMRIDPVLRTPKYKGIEKWLLRSSFEESKLLPREVLFRIKSAFSDAVSSKKRSWVNIIKEFANKMYSDGDVDDAKKYYKHLPPISKESLYYRDIFADYFGDNISVSKTIPYFWMPRWSGDVTDPSARVLSVCKEGTYL